MPQCMGQNLVTAPLELGGGPQPVEDTGSGDTLAEIQLLSNTSGATRCDGSSPFQPLLGTGAGKPRAHASEETRLVPHLCQLENHGHLTSEIFLPSQSEDHSDMYV
ncbi:unnamed protein product [Pleuronectes platessa]|uniref:Uncharacterized protein n=1 Tax=Pleuronectes platessa TaxID=8262 RepID=A0A9N7U5P4_PLEPL|nr:unnamed protein product [Pleuronectes platessa]